MQVNEGLSEKCACFAPELELKLQAKHNLNPNIYNLVND